MRRALEVLLTEGYVYCEEKGAAKLHTSLNPYREIEDPYLVPTSSQFVPNSSQSPQSDLVPSSPL